MPLDLSFHNTKIYIVLPEHIASTTLTFECIKTLVFLKLYFIRLHSFKFCMVQLEDAIQFFSNFWRNRPRIAILCTWLNYDFYFGICLFVFDVFYGLLNLEKGWSFLLCQFVFIDMKIRQKTCIGIYLFRSVVIVIWRLWIYLHWLFYIKSTSLRIPKISFSW